MLLVQFLFIIVQFLLLAVNGAFMIRVVLSWIMPDGDNVFIRVTCFMTEIFIVPYRVLFDKKGWFQGTILDVPFFAGYISVGFVFLIVSTLYENIIW